MVNVLQDDNGTGGCSTAVREREFKDWSMHVLQDNKGSVGLSTAVRERVERLVNVLKDNNGSGGCSTAVTARVEIMVKVHDNSGSRYLNSHIPLVVLSIEY